MSRALAADPQAIRAALAAAHLGSRSGLDPKALRAHLIVHELVEKQLLEDDPPEVGQALDRLLAQGLERHEAAHRIGMVVTRQAMGMLRTGGGLDRAAYVAELAKL